MSLTPDYFPLNEIGQNYEMDIPNSQNYWTVTHACINAGAVSLRLMTLNELF